jgi:hypothetical protein
MDAGLIGSHKLDLELLGLLVGRFGKGFRTAASEFDAINSLAPTILADPDGLPVPAELLHARQLTARVWHLQPNGSEILFLAARCQHIARWRIPREQYPITRAGYHQWRNALKQMHAKISAEILLKAGYAEETARRVQSFNLKENLKTDPEQQVLEDALCLVFLQFQFAELNAKTEREKMINALRRSWGKMSEQGRKEALQLSYSPEQLELIQAALAS